MDDAVDPGQQRTVPVDPPVHVETFASHYTLTWKSNGFASFIEAVQDVDSIPSSATVVTENPDIAGRQQHELTTLDVEKVNPRYIQVQPSVPWTLSWERRTWPIVSVSGTPPPEYCRDIHLATTGCSVWRDGAFAQLERMTASVR